jgi:Tfp pilus assembly protein PilO
MKLRTRLIVVGAGLVLLALLMYVFLIRPRQADLADTQTQIATEENTTQALQLELARLQALEENAPELNAQLKKVRGLVPRKASVERFIRQIQRVADEAGVEFVDIGPEVAKPPPEGAAVAEVRMTVGVGGDFFSVQDFVRRFYDLERAVRIDILGLAASEDIIGERTLTLTATARIFFELPPGSVAVPEADGTITPGTEATPPPGGDGTTPPPAS